MIYLCSLSVQQLLSEPVACTGSPHCKWIVLDRSDSTKNSYIFLNVEIIVTCITNEWLNDLRSQKYHEYSRITRKIELTASFNYKICMYSCDREYSRGLDLKIIASLIQDHSDMLLVDHASITTVSKCRSINVSVTKLHFVSGPFLKCFTAF